MDGKLNLNDTRLLIDFSSPVAKRRIPRTPSIPLIPVPTGKTNISLSPTNNNPFDVVARQTVSAEADDPFECAFKSAFNDNIQQPNLKEEKHKSSLNESVNKCRDSALNRSPLVKIDSPDINNCSAINKSSENGLLACSEKSDNSIFSETTSNATIVLKKATHSSSLVSNSDSNFQESGDYSSEEGLKAVIAKRVNKCIQKVLNKNDRSILGKEGENGKDFESDTYIKHTPCNRRSLSFIASSDTFTKCERLNKSCTDSQVELSILANQELNAVDSLIDITSSDMKLLTIQSDEACLNDDSVFLHDETYQIFEEANRLANTFSKISETFTKNNADVSDHEEDLLSCKPRWLYTDSSEDEDEKLKKDPALNIRVSFTGSSVNQPNDSAALAAFKNRRSLSHLTGAKIQGEADLKRSSSFAGNLITGPVVPSLAPSVPLGLINTEEQLIRLKKKTAVDPKRGPLKAMIPIQSMRKESTKPEVKIPVVSIRDPSPIRKPLHVMETPQRNNREVRLRPVACSTPNKFITTNKLPNVPTIDVPSNKRRSLGSTVENRSRNPVLESGSRQRSNSATCANSSSVPTPLAHTKSLKAHLIVKSPLKPKSTSNLARTASINSQNAQNGSKSEKKTKSKLNPRALGEVKSKSPRQGRVKSTMTAISSLVTGKGKKGSPRDKENRVPA